jgi:metal transporter CNNM
MVKDDTFLTKETLHQFSQKGFSRIPIQTTSSPATIRGALLVKKLIEIDPDLPPTVSSLPSARVLNVQQTTPLFSLFNDFITNRTHMAIVHDGETITGIVTLEDLMEEVLQEEIEGDLIMDPENQRRKTRAKTLGGVLGDNKVSPVDHSGVYEDDIPKRGTRTRSKTGKVSWIAIHNI